MSKKEDRKHRETNNALPASKSFFSLLQNIQKNIIISNNNIQVFDLTDENINFWLKKLEFLFDTLYFNNHILKDKDKIEIAVMKMNIDLFAWYCNIGKVETWCEFVLKLKEMFVKKEDVNNKLFPVNKWVKIRNSENELETGLINKILENGFYEVLCKGQIIKIHQISIEEY